MKFGEVLPGACPPADAHEKSFSGYYRLLRTDKPTLQDFASAAALGEPKPPTVDDCRFASCSLVVDPASYRKLPKLKNHKFAALLEIPAGAGRAKLGPRHADFWRAAGFDPCSAIHKIEAL